MGEGSFFTRSDLRLRVFVSAFACDCASHGSTYSRLFRFVRNRYSDFLFPRSYTRAPKWHSSFTCVNSNRLRVRLLLRSDSSFLPSVPNSASRLRSGGDRSVGQKRFGSGNSFRYRRILKRGSRFVGCVQLSYVRVCLHADLQIIRENDRVEAIQPPL